MTGPERGADNLELAFGREVLLQALRTAFEAACAAGGQDAAEALAGVLGPGADAPDLWDLARASIDRGDIRLLFVADPRLPVQTRLAHFLNAQMEGTDAGPLGAWQLAPMLDPLADVPLALRGWDERSFFKELSDRRGPMEAAIASALLSWARDRGLAIRWEGDAARSGFTPWLEVRGQPYALATVRTDGSIEIDVDALRATPPFASDTHALPSPGGGLGSGGIPADASPLDAQIQDVDIDDASLARLASEPGALERFIAAQDWIVDAILATR